MHDSSFSEDLRGDQLHQLQLHYYLVYAAAIPFQRLCGLVYKEFLLYNSEPVVAKAYLMANVHFSACNI